MRSNLLWKVLPESKKIKYIKSKFIKLILVIGAITLVNDFFSTMKAYKRETAHSMEYAVSLIDVSYLENAYEKNKGKI